MTRPALLDAETSFGDAPLAFDVRTERDIEFVLVSTAVNEDGTVLPNSVPSVAVTESPSHAFDKADGGPEVDLGRARTSFMPWVAAGAFHGTIELRDAEGKPAGSVIISARFDRTVHAAGPPVAADPATARLLPPVDTARPLVQGSHDVYSNSDVRDAFTAFDLDSNGYVGAAEIREVLARMGEAATDEEVRHRCHTSILHARRCAQTREVNAAHASANEFHPHCSIAG